MNFPATLTLDGQEIDGHVTVKVTVRDTSFSHEFGVEREFSADVEFVEFSTDDPRIGFVRQQVIESAGAEWVAKHQRSILNGLAALIVLAALAISKP